MGLITDLPMVWGAEGARGGPDREAGRNKSPGGEGISGGRWWCEAGFTQKPQSWKRANSGPPAAPFPMPRFKSLGLYHHRNLHGMRKGTARRGHHHRICPRWRAAIGSAARFADANSTSSAITHGSGDRKKKKQSLRCSWLTPSSGHSQENPTHKNYS